MTIPCGTITVHKPPANITATNMIIYPTDCDEPCNTTVTVTWANTGGATQTITPAIVIDGVTTPASSPITLNGGDTVSVIFNISGLMEGNHTICPDPN